MISEQRQYDGNPFCPALSTEPLLEVSSLSKSYRSVKALHEITFAMRPGEILGLLGQNGAGKTTLLQIIAGLLRADSGVVRLFGHPISRESLDSVAYLPEQRGIYMHERPGSVIRYFLELKGYSQSESRKAAIESMDRLELAQFKDKRIDQLSKGNQQRVQLAAAVAGRPRLVLLDEPTTGLDPVNSRFVAEIIRQMAASGSAILLATHQMHFVESLCRRVLMINAGRCALDGDVKTICATHSHGVVRVKTSAPIGSCPMIASMRPEGDGVLCRLSAGATPNQFLQWVAESGIELSLFEIVSTTLEDVFMEIINGENF